MHLKHLIGIIVAIYLGSSSISSAAEEDIQPYTLPEVRVTVNKIEEDLQKVPESITVFDEQQVSDTGMSDIGDLAVRVPNLSFSTGGLSLINLPVIRGVRSDPHSNVPSVILYIDEVPVAMNAGYIAGLYNAQSIEVLRGPQGTLYGRNAEGGVIKITTLRPGPDTRGGLTLKAGYRGAVQSQANLSGELVEGRLYASGSLQYSAEDGWVKNIYDDKYVDDKRNYSGRGTVRLTPQDDLDISLSFGVVKFDEGTFGMYDRSKPWGKRRTNSQDPGTNDSKFNDQALNVTYRLNPNWTLVSVTTRRESDLDYSMDYDFMPVPGFEVHRTDWSSDIGQEFRLVYDNGAMNAVMGLMYSNTKKKVRYNYYNAGMKHYAKDETQVAAAFTQVKIPFADNWAITLGSRFDYYTSDFNNYDVDYSDDDFWTSFSPKLALEYTITADNMVYASVARGFRAAGYDAYQGRDGHWSFDEEELWAFELGSKNSFWDNKIRLNAALFYNKYQDMQLEVYTSTLMGPMPSIKNVGNPDAYGGELELNIMPVAGLEFFGSMGYTHMRYDNFEDDLGKYNGNKVPYIPEFTYSTGAQYRHETGLYLRAEVLGTTKTYLNSANNGYIPSHAMVNAKIGWEFENINAYFYADNVFDKRYDYVNAFGGTYGVVTAGATYGMIFSYNF